ncbi:MAG: hypothetical protein LBE09_09365 [Christensenellaceae bacterium]|jgi:hypothetical protein|nr:hypothetical protein [Christensenellaceae bacterium]
MSKIPNNANEEFVTLLLHEQKILPSEVNRHIAIPIRVSQEYAWLVFKYEYQPKIFDDPIASMEYIRKCAEESSVSVESLMHEANALKNHLTLSIDSPDGWVGTAHRHNNKLEIVINSQRSTEGFLPTPITMGKWIATVSTHCVLSPVNVKLKVVGCKSL